MSNKQEADNNSKKVNSLINPKSLFCIVSIPIVILAIEIILVTIYSSHTVPGNASTILAIIGLASLGIERLLEGIWSIVDLSGTWLWPLDLIKNQVDEQIESLNQLLQPLEVELEKAAADLQKVANNAKSTDEEKNIQNAKNGYKQISKDIADQLKVAVAARCSASNTDIIVNIASKIQNWNEKYIYPIDAHTIKQIAENIQTGAKGLDQFIQSFTDNPGRKILSLYAGVFFGLIIAWILQLNLLVAALPSDTNYPAALGIISAGIVMGLGSSPAHEIIQAITNWRQNLGN